MARKRIKDSEGIVGRLQKGEFLKDKTGNTWKLGKAIGIGGFGEIYDISSCKSRVNVDQKSRYVAKIEKHTSGPLFVEINCYLRLGQHETIEKWKVENNLTFLGMPHFVASGSHSSVDKYRFLVLPKYNKDLEAILRTKRVFNLKTVLVIASRIIDTLEYIHSHGYVHSDIKAPNIMLGQSYPRTQPKRQCRYAKKTDRMPLRIHKKCKHHRFNLRSVRKTNYSDDSVYLDEMLYIHEFEAEVKSASKTFEGDEIYLLDYGLATKYILNNGEHRKFAVDHRRSHAGTIQFCSRDAHKGVASRRSDLESLAYNMIYWLTGTLPWIGDVDDPELVEKKKNKVFTDVKLFLQICFENVPQFLVDMFTYLSKLSFEDAPDYNFFRELFKKTIQNYGYKNDWKLDFDNLEGWGRKTLKNNKKENKCVFKRPSLLLYSPLKPLSSNIIFKRPKLRKKINHKLAQDSMMNWSKILVDPETIIKQGTNRQKSPDDDPLSISEEELESMNPTPVMREVYGKLSEKLDRLPYYGCRKYELSWREPIEGYTAEMMRVHRQAVERQELEMHLSVRQSMKKCKRKRLNASVSPSRTVATTRTRTCRRA